MARHFGEEKASNANMMSALGLTFCTDCHEGFPEEHSLFDIEVRGTSIKGNSAPQERSIIEFAEHNRDFLQDLFLASDDSASSAWAPSQFVEIKFSGRLTR